jgi:alpha-beta hydrolase superfamily lysophospholipase
MRNDLRLAARRSRARTSRTAAHVAACGIPSFRGNTSALGCALRLTIALSAILAPARLVAQDAKSPSEIRADYRKLLDRPKVPLDVKTHGTKPGPIDGWTIETLDFASEKKADGSFERVPTILSRPTKSSSPRPIVIVLHGTGGNAEGQIPFLKELAARDILGVAIDARYHGKRSGGAKGAAAYNDAITRAWKTGNGHPFYYDTVWDLWRLVDYLETRPDVDARKIGMIGFSMGGIETWLAASVDERVLVSVPAIAVQSFRWSLDNDAWQGRANSIKAAHQAVARDLGESAVNQRVCRELWNKVIPGITGEFDCPNMLRLFPGRPLLIVGGTKDPNCPYTGAKIAVAAAESAYKEAGATDKLRVLYADVGHSVTAEQRRAALDWFSQWLVKK